MFNASKMKDPASYFTATVISILIIISCCWSGISGQPTPTPTPVPYYCSDDPKVTVVEITNQTEGSIITRYPGDSYYRNNQNCVWLIDAGANNRVEFYVSSTDLQWAPESPICPGYDYVAIKDVFPKTTTTSVLDEEDEGDEESIVLQWCGHMKPLGAISNGRYARVEFGSDKNNPYQFRGVHLKFFTFSSSECAPSWNSSPEGTCLKVLDKIVDWSSAQRACNAEDANLASFVSEDEHQFVLQRFQEKEVWIGLNDITEQGRYQWIDRNPLSINKFPEGHLSDQYARCVTLNLRKENWQLENCDQYQTRPLCMSNKGRETELYPLPKETEEDNETPWRIILPVIISAVVLFAVCIAFIYKCRNRRSHRKGEAHRMRNPRHGDEDTVSFQQATPSAPPPPPSHDRHDNRRSARNPPQPVPAPPSYEEAVSQPVVVY